LRDRWTPDCDFASFPSIYKSYFPCALQFAVQQEKHIAAVVADMDRQRGNKG
jgi:hypothetical protein